MTGKCSSSIKKISFYFFFQIGFNSLMDAFPSRHVLKSLVVVLLLLFCCCFLFCFCLLLLFFGGRGCLLLFRF